ncbi:cysteine proteinase inhibitor 5 [Phtheirospermum japonicum]|uniref:Cysteine proteinase inhibitor 5 n=1 Tax=Phtheirospermum japonicum TaxID=374723 RepID=A0A830C7I3_9LAMI|nr:cysteine proteinase inhibitor 5 [Phtheirospermum japonicum]
MTPFVFIFLSILVALTPIEASRPKQPGGEWPIDNLEDPEVVVAARFAVAEHNKEASASLSFVSVVNGTQQVVAGMRYRLHISTNDGKIYRADVWTQSWLRFLKLISFEEIDYLTYAPAPAPKLV